MKKIFAVLFLVTFIHSSSYCKTKRIVNYDIYLDDELIQNNKIEELLQFSFQLVNDAYEPFGVTFVKNEKFKWTPKSNLFDFQENLLLTRKYIKQNNVDIQIFLSSSKLNKNSQRFKQSTPRGLSPILGTKVLITIEEKELNKIYLSLLLTHEIAHLFGAYHVNNSNSIMFPYIDIHHESIKFDSNNYKIIELQKNYNFSNGIDKSSANIIGKISTIFLQDKDKNDMNPISQGYNALAYNYVYSSNLDSAEFFYLEAIKYDSNNCILYKNLGVTYLNKYEYELSERYLKHALFLCSNDESLHFNLAVLDTSKSEFGNSIFHLKNALELNPNYVDAIYLLALSYLTILDTNNSIKQLEEIIKIDNTNTKADSLLKIIAQ